MVEKRQCNYCGKDIFLSPSRTHQERFFCNNDCFKKSRKTNKYIKCENCNIKIEGFTEYGKYKFEYQEWENNNIGAEK